MKQICIPVPSLQNHQTVDVEVTVDGVSRHMNYRLESFDWAQEGLTTPHKIQRLRELIQGYDPGWELVQIGVPDRNLIPVMFRRSSPALS